MAATPEAELRVTHPGPYITFTILSSVPIFAAIVSFIPQDYITFTGHPAWAYASLLFGLFGMYYYVFGAWWHRHIIYGDEWIVQQGMRYYFIPERWIVSIGSITKMRQETGTFGVEFNGLFVYYKSGDLEKKFPIVLIAHPYRDLIHFLSVLHQKRPDLEIPLLAGRKRSRVSKSNDERTQSK